jgi:hypothetical protein
MKTKHIAILTLASALLLPGLSGAAYEPQDNDNRDACCLAAEYRLPESQPQSQPKAQAAVQHSSGTAKTRCQVPLGDVACCIGAEWKLDAQ